MPTLAKLAYVSGRYMTPIVVTERSGRDLVDYAVKVVLGDTWDGWDRVRADASDVYFTDEVGSPLYFWIDVWDYDRKYAELWVKVPKVPANGEVTVYLNYGSARNPYARYHDPENVFLLFDHFTALDTAKWSTASRTSDEYGVQDSALYHKFGATWNGRYFLSSGRIPFPNIAVLVRWKHTGSPPSGSPKVHNLIVYLRVPGKDYPRDTTYYYTIKGTLPAPLFGFDHGLHPHNSEHSGTACGSAAEGSSVGWYPRATSGWDVEYWNHTSSDADLPLFPANVWVDVEWKVTETTVAARAVRRDTGEELYSFDAQIDTALRDAMGGEVQLELCSWGYDMEYPQYVDLVLVRKAVDAEPAVSVKQSVEVYKDIDLM